MEDLTFTNFVRTPFRVKALEITEENIEQVAKLIGEVRSKGKNKYIATDRRIIPNVPRAHIGWFLTEHADNYRCYHPDVFNSQFRQMPDGDTVSFVFDLEDDEAPATIVG